MAARSFPSTENPGTMGSLRMRVFFLSLTISASFLLLLAVLFVLFYLYYSLFQRSRTLPFEASPPPSELHRFTYKELRSATRGFASGNFVGKGGSGSVYRGVLADGKSVAVKRLGSSPSDPDREFRNETQVLGGIRSPFVVSLIGYAAEKERLFLVYEYMPNRSLQEALFGEEDGGGGRPALRWPHRFEIVLDVARGLKFLHSECDPPIVHGDIKPSNVLLGKDYRAKISDFGLSRLKTEGELGIDFYSQELWKSQELSGNLAALPLHQPFPSSSSKDRNFDSRAYGCEKGKEVRDDDDGDVGSERSHRVASSPVDDQMSSSKKWGKDWWWRQDASGELSSRDYVMEWIGSQICPASNPDWEEEDELKLDSTPAKQHDDSGNAMAASEALNGAAQILGETSSAAKKKESKRGLNKLKSNKKMKEWWKEEYFAEMSSKRADRKLKTSKSEGRRWKRRLKTMLFDLGTKVQIIRREEGASTRHDNALYAAAAVAADSPSFKRVWKRKKKKTSVKSEEDLFSRELSSTTSMRGTICYVAPEYGGCGYLMEKADIYSFGVLILVIVSGRRPLHVLASPMKLEQANLVSWCRTLAQRGNVLELVDERLKGEFDRDEASLCINLALMCLQKMPELRPDAGDIVRIMKGEMELPTLPLECSPSPPSKLFGRSRRGGGEVE